MLSKLYHFEKNLVVDQMHKEAVLSALIEYLKREGRNAHVDSFLCKGTLGIVAAITVDGKKMIAKSHLDGERYQCNLKKEYSVLSKLYKETLNISIINLAVLDKEYSIVLMDMLEPVTERLSLVTIQTLTNQYKTQFSKISKELFKKDYSINELMNWGNRALAVLAENKLISKNIADCIQQVFSQNSELLLKEPMIFCHGDLSNKNIMRKDNQYVVLDWEDAFLGVDGYDEIYWLTFLDQADYLKKSHLVRHGLYTIRTQYLLLLIVLLKSYISFRNQSYLMNHISFEIRLRKVLELFV
ncbi:phosphotransferase [Propionispora hippei]|uniref:Phosphotransferase enzyme family protein n=1 Tax=Propionispora hippei DSM 15287 TaxID=1123003 RepID=A0A1M6FHM7_9FIRM|nr:phosphotransferase [Propionispora hippei]SHI97185.1 Phosphotransferase enzyme family protein [Propionispora hippei DSM 15287]